MYPYKKCPLNVVFYTSNFKMGALKGLTARFLQIKLKTEMEKLAKWRWGSLQLIKIYIFQLFSYALKKYRFFVYLNKKVRLVPTLGPNIDNNLHTHEYFRSPFIVLGISKWMFPLKTQYLFLTHSLRLCLVRIRHIKESLQGLVTQ